MSVYATKWTFVGEDKFSKVAETIQKSLNSLSNAYSRLQKQALRSNEVMKKFEALETKLPGETFILSQRVNELSRSMNILDKQLRNSKRSMQSLRTQSASLRGELTQIFFTGLSFSVPIRSAVKFEDSLLGIKRAMRGITDKELAELGQKAIKLSESIPVAAADILEIARQGSKMGVPLQDLTKFAELASKTSVAFDIKNIEKVGQDLGFLSNIFKLNQNSMESFLDVIDTFDNSIATTGEKIVRSLVNKGARGAQALGLTNEQAIALVATLDALGIRAERVGRGVLSIANRLASTKTRGFLNKETLELLKKSPQEGLNKILISLGKLERTKRTAVIQEMFGKDFSDIINSLVDNFDQYQKNISVASDKLLVSGALQREYGVKLTTTSAQLKLLKNHFSNLSTIIGGAFIPVLLQIIEFIKPIIAYLSQIIHDNQKLTATILGIIGAAAGLKIFVVILRLIKIELASIAAISAPLNFMLAATLIIAYALYKTYKTIKQLFNGKASNEIDINTNENVSTVVKNLISASQTTNGNLNININDPGNNVGLVQGESKNMNMRVGRNMPFALSSGLFDVNKVGMAL